MKVEIEPVWRFRKPGGGATVVVMIGVLEEIRRSGKLMNAAKVAGLSYRHVWNLLEAWSAFFGVPLVVTRRGKGTTLTGFGERLVWAGQRMQARLGPQLDNLAQELLTDIKPHLQQPSAVARVHASHGFAVAKLRELLIGDGDTAVDVRYVSNRHSLQALVEDACDLSGVHVPQGELRRRSLAAMREWLDPDQHRIVRFVTREVGLMVKRNNPLRIASLQDLTRPELRFINRDHDSGTRLLFDQLLSLNGIDPTRINGAQQVEFTHAAVAAYVASGMADVAFGVKAAAVQFGLEFLPLVIEDYVFVCRKEFLETDAMRRVLETMKGTTFQSHLTELTGYSSLGAGSVNTVGEFLRSARGR